MKKLLGIVVLGLLWCNISLTDDIGDFQIEGISVGDSLLDYLSIAQIEQQEQNGYLYKDAGEGDNIFIIWDTGENDGVFDIGDGLYAYSGEDFEDDNENGIRDPDEAYTDTNKTRENHFENNI